MYLNNLSNLIILGSFVFSLILKIRICSSYIAAMDSDMPSLSYDVFLMKVILILKILGLQVVLTLRALSQVALQCIVFT